MFFLYLLFSITLRWYHPSVIVPIIGEDYIDLVAYARVARALSVCQDGALVGWRRVASASWVPKRLTGSRPPQSIKGLIPSLSYKKL